MTGHRARLALALLLAGLAVPALLWAAAVDPAVGGALPDLDPAAPAGLALQRLPGERRVLLGWATTIHNRGPGALRLNAGARLASGERAVAQTTPDGRTALAASAGRLRYVTGYGHRHWHLVGLARYTLTTCAPAASSPTASRASACTPPGSPRASAPASSPTLRGSCSGSRPAARTTYEAQLEGQHITITPASAPTGIYVLSQTVDPQHRLHQASRANDGASLRLRLGWRPGAPLPAVTELRACPDTPTCAPS